MNAIGTKLEKERCHRELDDLWCNIFLLLSSGEGDRDFLIAYSISKLVVVVSVPLFVAAGIGVT